MGIANPYQSPEKSMSQKRKTGWLNGQNRRERAMSKILYVNLCLLTSMQKLSCKMPGWMNYKKLESRLLGNLTQPPGAVAPL